MAAGGKALPHPRVNAQFFQQLAPQAFFRGFACMDLAAGELPFQRHAHGRAMPGGQDKTAPLDDGAGDVDMPRITQASTSL